MATVKGQNLRIFADQVVIAAALQCELHVALNTKQISTKDTEGAFSDLIVVSLNWDAKVNGAVTTDPDRNDPASLMSRIGQTVRVQFAIAEGEQNSEMGDLLVSGDAILSDVQITAENRRRGTYDITLTGCKNLLNELRLIRTSDGNFIRTASGHLVAAPHQQ
jgi:hypothetical protein